MASIQKTAKGYRAQVYVKGTRDSQLFRTKREADAWAAEREAELRELAAKRIASDHTLRDALTRYRDEVSPKQRGGKWETLRIDAFIANHPLPLDTKLGEILPEQMAEWRDWRSKRAAAGTVLREISLLGAVLEQARIEWRWFKHNPLRDIRKPSAPPHRERLIHVWEIRTLLRAMNYRSTGRITEMRQAVACCFLAALRTGMRAGELTGLTWDRVRDDHVILPVTKTFPRKPALSRQAARVIKRMRGWDERLVFGIGANSLDANFRKYRERAGLDGFTFHDSRHTAATMLAQKLHLGDLCKQFGWSDPKQAMIYYNPTPADIAKRLNAR